MALNFSQRPDCPSAKSLIATGAHFPYLGRRLSSAADGMSPLRHEEAMDINMQRRSQVEIIQLRGPLRLGPAVNEFRQALDQSLSNGDTRIVLDLAEVPMIDSSGIGVLMKSLASARQRGGNIKLVNPSKFAVQTLRMVGLLNLFEVFSDADAAVASFA
jgi:anti-sigma B factor antagonist